MKIHDVDSMFEIHGQEEICSNCEHAENYYESDTGYHELSCKGNPPVDCQEAIKNFLKEGDEEMKENEDLLKLDVDLNSFKASIVNSIKSELRQEIKKDLKKEIVKQIYDEVAKPQIEELKTTVSNLVSDLLKTEIEAYYNDTKIQVGGGWDNPAEEFTVKEYTQNLLKKAIETGSFETKKTKYTSDTHQIDKYIVENCITREITSFLDNKLKAIQKDVNSKVKNVFETKVETMMSEVALGVLKSNATYNDISKKLLG